MASDAKDTGITGILVGVRVGNLEGENTGDVEGLVVTGARVTGLRVGVVVDFATGFLVETAFNWMSSS